MDLLGEERGQSIQIGAIILFGALIILLSTYQAFVIPDQNRGVEFKHSQTVQNDMKELRSGVISVASSGGESSVSVQLGTEYPSRAIFLNPGPPSGSLRTVGTSNASIEISVANATAAGGTTEVGDYWNGTTRNYSTGALVYRPNYNQYGSAPTTVYSNSVLYNRFADGNLTLTDQSLVEGRSINLIALNGSLSAGQSGSASVDVRATSASATRVPVTNQTAGENVTFRLPTRLSQSAWDSLLQAERVTNGGHVRNVTVLEQSGRFDELVVEMEPDVTYNLKLSRVGVGSSVDTTAPGSYLVKTRGQNLVVPEGQNVTLAVEVRDRYNNPSNGELVSARTSRSDSDITELAESDSEGTVELEYSPPDDIDGGAGTDSVNVSLDSNAVPDSSFNTSTSENVSFSLSIDNTNGSGTTSGTSGSYTVKWETPTDSQVSSCPQSPPQGSCVVGSPTSFLYDLDLTMTTDPTADGADVTYDVSNQTALFLEQTTGVTDSNGEDTTTVFPLANSTEYVYTNSGSGGDRLELDVTVDDDISGTAADPDNTGTNSGVQFSVTNDADQAVNITEVFVEPQDSAVGRLDDPVAGEGQWDSEFFFDVEGTTYTADFGGGEALPFNFDLSTGTDANDEPTIGSGQTMDIYMYQFRNDADTANVSMDGRTLNMSFTFSNGVRKNFTVTMGGGTGSTVNAYITAAEPNPGNNKSPSDSEIEFVRFELPSGPDTSTWEVVDADGNTQSFPSDLSGTVYFAGDPTTFANQWNGVSAGNVYDLGSVSLNNGGDNVILRDGSGTARDEFAWGTESTSGGWSFTFSSDGQVANRSYSGRSYDDTDSAADFSEVAECDFFGGGDGCAQAPSLSSSIVDQGQASTQARYEVSYDITNTANFDRVEVSFDNLDSGGADQTYTRTAPRTNVDDYGWVDSYGGTGDIDGDSSPELVYTNSNGKFEYLDAGSGDKAETTTLSGSPVLNTPNAVGQPADFDGDGADEIPYINGDKEVKYVNGPAAGDTAGSSTVLTTGAGGEYPVGAADVAGDSRPEIVYVDTSGNQRLAYAGAGGTDGFVTDFTDSEITAANNPGAS